MVKKEIELKMQEVASELGLPAVDPTDDYFEQEGARIDVSGRVNVALQEIADKVGGLDNLDATLTGDEGALLRPSTAPPSALPPRTAEQETQVRNVAQAAATLANPHARNVIDPNLQAVLANVVKKALDLPAPDITTYVDNRRLVVSGNVIGVPNKIPRKKALEVLEAMLQDPGDCKGDKRYPDGRIDPCPCPTHEVVRMAQWNGFREKPHVWLSQHLAVEVTRDSSWDKLTETFPFDVANDGTLEAPIPRVISSMFSADTAREFLKLARIHQASVVSLFRILTQRICVEARRQKTPTEYTGQFD